MHVATHVEFAITVQLTEFLEFISEAEAMVEFIPPKFLGSLSLCSFAGLSFDGQY
jgi:hypothetical protein